MVPPWSFPVLGRHASARGFSPRLGRGGAPGGRQLCAGGDTPGEAPCPAAKGRTHLGAARSSVCPVATTLVARRRWAAALAGGRRRNAPGGPEEPYLLLLSAPWDTRGLRVENGKIKEVRKESAGSPAPRIPAVDVWALPTCLVPWGWGWTRSRGCFTFTALLQVPRPCGLRSETRCVFPCLLDPRDQSVWSDPVCGGRTGSGKGNGVRVVLS